MVIVTKKEDIKHVTQGENDCVLACLAMVSGHTLEEVHQVYPEFDGIGVDTMTTLALAKHLGLTCVLYVNPIIVWDRVYIITVPSLNFEGGNHCIVCYSDKETEELTILDPAEGKEGRKFYTKETLRCWSECIEIIL